MIHSIKIGNFKAFGETQEIPVKPLTLLFGQNSVGKSSLLHALLFIEEVAKRKSIDIHQIKKNNQTIDLGGPKQYLHRDEKEFTIGGKLSIQENFTVGEYPALLKHFCELDPDDYVGGESFGIKGLFHWEIKFDISEKDKTYITEFYLRCPKVIVAFPETDNAKSDDIITEEIEWVEPNTGETLTGEYRYELRRLKFSENESNLLIIKGDEKSRDLKVVGWKKFHPGALCILGEGNLNDDHYITESENGKNSINLTKDEFELTKIADWRFKILFEDFKFLTTGEKDIQVLFKEHEIKKYFDAFFDKVDDEFSKLVYEPPLRQILDRDTFSSEEYFGPYWKDILENDAYLEMINVYLSNETLLDLDYELVLEEYESNLRDKKLSTLALKSLSNDKILSFKDVGTGLSQLIPIVSAIAVMDNSVILMEQPELHLHPGLQSRFGKILSRIPKTSNKAIVETHSEHLIKSVQLEVARHKSTKGEEGINKDDLAVLYISNKDGEAKIREIELDESGSFTEPWPDDFFDSSADLTMERLKFMQRNKN